jgi:hypothetical protein
MLPRFSNESYIPNE